MIVACGLAWSQPCLEAALLVSRREVELEPQEVMVRKGLNLKPGSEVTVSTNLVGNQTHALAVRIIKSQLIHFVDILGNVIGSKVPVVATEVNSAIAPCPSECSGCQ